MAESFIEEVDNPKGKILAICGAGINRSGHMKEILRGRGYEAENRGVINNKVETQDLDGVQTIIFASVNEQKIFETRPELMDIVRANGIELKHINATQSDDDRAHREHATTAFKEKIASELTSLGFTDLKKEPVESSL